MNPSHDLLLLVPVGHELSLDLRAEVGNVMVDGEFDTLSVHADVGDLVLGPLTATERLTATSEVGNIDIELASPAPASVDITAAVGDVDLLLPVDAGGDVAITAELGSVDVALPGSARWEVAAESELGSVDVDRSLTGGTTAVNGTLTVTSELGGSPSLDDPAALSGAGKRRAGARSIDREPALFLSRARSDAES
ncbi:hypothetical protein H3H54_06690 [Brachybacterium sp. Z12]|uniref:DUF4097 domain-containing protein n=1 Tax=Brachybacterium sp. Z12 TaxID=2759167 RepID=UPI0018613524|nr:DUF4097 domain-containing protein [Brachybacterium sp. Z12]QNN83275.1 hypothetical protein H3H54_06690 [Brachybacterium sp. Z12]